jgi:hypothetical protein
VRAERIEERRNVFSISAATPATRSHNDAQPRSYATGVVRIVALGDNFAYGIVGYEKNFLTRLEQAGEARRPSVEVVNLGLPGLQPKDYLQMLAEEASRCVPIWWSVVVRGNDLMRVGAATPFDERNWRLVGFALQLWRFAAEPRARLGCGGGCCAEARDRETRTFSEAAYLDIAMSWCQSCAAIAATRCSAVRRRWRCSTRSSLPRRHRGVAVLPTEFAGELQLRVSASRCNSASRTSISTPGARNALASRRAASP